MKPIDHGPEVAGAHILGDSLTAPDIWTLLHSNAREWRTVPRNARFYELREMIDEADFEALRMLKDCEAQNWQHLCFGAGWTRIGAVALSWCKGCAGLGEVAAFWSMAYDSFEVSDETKRMASQIAPGRLPVSRILSELITELDQDTRAVALALLCLGDQVKIDLQTHNRDAIPEMLWPVLGLGG